ncbi:Pentatricopeptide repeat [Dillenia turbinata]|uniref:Pentatricopeptide repeat n=1 Tax=Dillenia turbinata TaxID=194707 RepID=A0AAN8VIV8_9MAGN
MIVGYFRTGHFDEVLRLYSDLKCNGIGLDSSAITFSIKSCVEFHTIDYCRGIHADAFKFGLNADQFVGSALISIYFHYGEVEDASKAFDEITERDVVVYTSMITGFSQIVDRRAYRAFKLARRMQRSQIEPNRVTLLSLLQAAAQLGALEEGLSIHGYALKRGLCCSDEVLETSLMDMYIKCGALKMGSDVFGEMRTRTVASWNAAIAGLMQVGQCLEALHLFRVMVRENVLPDLITLASGLFSCANLKCLLEGKSIHGYIIRNGVELDMVAMTALIDMYSKCNDLDCAKGLFDGLDHKDVVMFNVMMVAYLQNGFACEAIETFYEMIGEGIRPNLASILTVVSAVSEAKDIKQCRRIHGFVMKRWYESHIEIANRLAYMYANCGCIYNARVIFNRIEGKDVVFWASIMKGFVRSGYADEAVVMFQMMLREKIVPDSISLVILLEASARLGMLRLAREVHNYMYRQFLEKDIAIINALITTYADVGKLDLARSLFEQMKEVHCPTLWNAMIAAYGMHGDFSEVLKLFDQMKREKIKIDDVPFTSVLSACTHSGLVEEGLLVLKSMREEYDIVPSEEHYNCMIDLLGKAGRLEEAYDLVRRLRPKSSISALCALLVACRKHENIEMVVAVGRRLLQLEPRSPSIYALVFDLYGEDEKESTG